MTPYFCGRGKTLRKHSVVTICSPKIFSGSMKNQVINAEHEIFQKNLNPSFFFFTNMKPKSTFPVVFYRQNFRNVTYRNYFLLNVAISPFPAVFSKALNCRHVKNQGLYKKGTLTFEIKQFKRSKSVATLPPFGC